MASVTITRSREWWGFYRRILVEVDGKRVGGVWNGRDLKIDVPTGPHTFRALMGWIGSKPLEVNVNEGNATVLGVRAPWQEAGTATGLYRGPNSVMGPVAQGFFGHYTSGLPDEGLEIWEHPDQVTSEFAAMTRIKSTVARRRNLLGIRVLVAVYLTSVVVGPLIAHAAGASGDAIYFSSMAGPLAVFLITMAVYLVFSFVNVLRDSRQSQK